MPSLREIQSGFAAALLNPAASRQAPGVRADGISPATRIGFYRTNVFENYRKALGATYPAVERLVGRGFFGHLCEDYTRRYPSHCGDVGQHGDRFPDFLSEHDIASSLPYLTDVARLEWCMEESFNEADHAPLSLERLSAVPPEHYGALRLLLDPSCRILHSDFQVDRIWQMCQPDAQDEYIALDDGPVDLLIRRDNYAVVMERLTPPENALLSSLSSGSGFGNALNSAHALNPHFDASAFLIRYVTDSVLVDFTLPAELLG